MQKMFYEFGSLREKMHKSNLCGNRDYTYFTLSLVLCFYAALSVLTINIYQ